MNVFRPVFLSMALLILGSCSTNNGRSGADVEADDAENIQLDTAGLQGEWTLASYLVDCESMQFETATDYVLSFNEPDNTFGMTTDCNLIGGTFEITNDTIRFKNVLVTEMACDKMIVEKNMLRLFNDTTSYAVCQGDTILYTAPCTGGAMFIHVEKTTEQ